jgi:hypothetical protein
MRQRISGEFSFEVQDWKDGKKPGGQQPDVMALDYATGQES